jgi:hypothetical protein
MISINGVTDHVHHACPRCGYATRYKQWPIRCLCNKYDPTWLTTRRVRLHRNLADDLPLGSPAGPPLRIADRYAAGRPRR